MLAVTADSPSYPDSHREMELQVVTDFGIPQCVVTTHEMDRDDYRANRSDRCYFCKSELFEVLGGLRDELGFDTYLKQLLTVIQKTFGEIVQ